MKRLSDYDGEAALDLWADIFDPVSIIVNDPDIQKYTTGKELSVKNACKVIIERYRDEIYFILRRIDNDDSGINGANLFPRLLVFMTELTIGDSARDFFKSAEPGNSQEESSGSATENTGDGEA